MCKRVWICYLVIVALPLCDQFSFADVRYTITDLGTLGGGMSFGLGMNDSGEVVGYSTISDFSTQHAFLYDGTMHDLGTLGGANSSAGSINNPGTVLGTSEISNAIYRSFTYDGAIHQFGPFDETSVSVADINNHGVIVGTSTGSDPTPQMFLYDGTIHHLGYLAGGQGSNAYAVSDNGLVVGISYTDMDPDGSPHHAVLWDGTLHDLGAFAGGDSGAYDVNSAGIVVGDSDVTGGHQHAMYYDGTMHDLGTLGGPNSVAISINEKGEIVGAAYNADNKLRAFIYENGQMLDLNDLVDPNSRWELVGGRAINSAGQIVIDAVAAAGAPHHALLLTPLPEPACAVLPILFSVYWRRARRSASPSC